MYRILVSVLCAIGLWLLLSPLWPGVYRPAALAVRHRAPKPMSQTEVVVQRLAALLEPHMDMDPIERSRLSETLRGLGRPGSPELWRSRALARALLFSAAALPLVFLSPFFGAAGMALIGVAIYQRQSKALRSEMEARRRSIERELPQFASTIRQCLNSTHDVVAILSAYRKICGPALRDEITRTLNDMVTGNPERAIKALEGRVSSAKLGQVTRGLIAVLRGDDQRVYFDMLSAEFRKAQNEEVAKELQKRPGKLDPYMALLFICLCLMIAASLGTFLVQQMQAYS